MISRNDLCWCGSQKKWKKCHFPETGPISITDSYLKQYGIIIKNEEEIKKIRSACKTASTILKELMVNAKKGVTTQALDDLAVELHKKHRATPAPLGYGHPPYPKSICTSLNEVICHGIPNKRPLQEGDILNIDVTSIVDGYYGDVSAMVSIGKVSEEKQLVVETSLECLKRAIKVCKPGVMIKEIGQAIEDYARSKGCSVVNQFVGHGVGRFFHEPPQIPHHYNNLQIALVEGMTFTIEPMINAGVRESVIDQFDEWTARTKDGKPSAQWEHTLLITKDGIEVLTQFG